MNKNETELAELYPQTEQYYVFSLLFQSAPELLHTFNFPDPSSSKKGKATRRAGRPINKEKR